MPVSGKSQRKTIKQEYKKQKYTRLHTLYILRKGKGEFQCSVVGEIENENYCK